MITFEKKTALFLSFLLAAYAVPAEEGISSSTELALQLSTRPEAKLGITQSFIIPCMRFDNPLTQDNNLKAALGADVSPISMNGTAEFTWTPIACFQLAAGGRLGSGWNMPLGMGIGLNREKDGGLSPHKRTGEGDPFEGVFLSG
jgi:hypothetical protein